MMLSEDYVLKLLIEHNYRLLEKDGCDAPNFKGHFFFIQELNVQLFYKPKYMKLHCSNIFYKMFFQGHNSAFFILMASREHRLLVYLKGGSHDGVSKAQW